MPPRLLFRRASLWLAAPRARAGSGLSDVSDSPRQSERQLVDVLIEEGRIRTISAARLTSAPGDWEIDAGGRLLLPGFVDGHTHLERRLARGLSLGGGFAKSTSQLEEPLRSRFERALQHSDLEAAARLALAEAALAGTTTVFALCRSPACAEGSLDRLAGAAREIGVRAGLAYGASDRDGAFTVGVQEGARFCEANAAAGVVGGETAPAMVRGMLGLTHPEEAGDAALDALAEMATRHGLQLHAGESEAELARGFALHGRRTLPRLRDLKLLGPRTLLAHLNHVNRPEILALVESGCTGVFTPRAALLAEERPPRLEAALEGGLLGALGTDGLGRNASAELLFAFALWRRTARPAGQPEFYALERLAGGGRRTLQQFFGGSAPARPPDPTRLQEGDLADVVLLNDYGQPVGGGAGGPTASTASPASIVQLSQVTADASVAWTVVAGRVLVREGVLLGQDLHELAAHASERAEALCRRM